MRDRTRDLDWASNGGACKLLCQMIMMGVVKEDNADECAIVFSFLESESIKFHRHLVVRFPQTEHSTERDGILHSPR